jgi:hypothetical protein
LKKTRSCGTTNGPKFRPDQETVRTQSGSFNAPRKEIDKVQYGQPLITIDWIGTRSIFDPKTDSNLFYPVLHKCQH